MNGTIGFESEPGSGSVFHVTLPLYDASVLAEEAEVGHGELRTILYVEDDPDIQEVVTMALELVGGFEVTVAGSGREARSPSTAASPT